MDATTFKLKNPLSLPQTPPFRQATLKEVLQFLSYCPAGVYFTLPLGKSSLSEERATAPIPPLADARPSRKREGKCLADNDLKNCTTFKRESEIDNGERG